MDDLLLSLEWLRFAEMDLSSAEFLLRHRPLPKEIICFHCQQSVEKLLKGILIINNTEAPRTHDLRELFSQIKDFVPNNNLIKSACIELDQYSVQPRHPEEIHITEEDVHSAVKQAKKVLEFLKSLFPDA
ncbi:MAG: HEPN domain-containing protein [Candidatus Margulisbacteria bacterium]|jgi:HEPN domain-containing protein|nr:HEPN domain-containing protein [Candidatus Margulisiibacteriota bacterium]